MSLRDRRLVILPALTLVVLTAACGGDGDGDGGSAGAADSVTVASTDDWVRLSSRPRDCRSSSREIRASAIRSRVTSSPSNPAATPLPQLVACQQAYSSAPPPAGSPPSARAPHG